MRRDLTLALRSLRRSPGFTITALLLLSLGVGMTTSMATVFDAVVRRPLPVREPDRVILPSFSAPGGVTISLSPAELDAVRDASRTVRDIVGIAHMDAFAVPLSDGDRMLAMRGAWVTGSFFETLGVRPALGHLFGPEDEVPNASSSVIVLSYDAWRTAFAGDSTVIGRQLRSPTGFGHATVIGVAPAGLSFPVAAEYWAPIEYGSLEVMGRLAPGMTSAAATAELGAIVDRLVGQRRSAGRAAAVRVRTFTQRVLGDIGPQLRALLAAAGLLLLIATANVGILVLLRAGARSRDVALKRSLGARTIDIVRPLLFESAALCVAGGVLGLALARLILLGLARFAPPEIPRLDLLRLAPAPLALAAVLTLVPLLLGSALPALLAVKGAGTNLRSDAPGVTRSRSRRRVREALVTAQAATAVVLLAGAGLLVRTVERLTSVPIGFQADRLSVITVYKPVNIQTEGWHEPMGKLYDRIDPELRRVRGVVSVTPVNFAPFHGPEMFNVRWSLPGQSPAETASNPVIPYEVGGPEYFRTLGIPLLRGRGFLETDVAGAPEVAVVSRALAERFWPGESPVGKQLLYNAERPPVTVVGEAGDIRYRTLREPTPTVFLPWRQVFFQGYVAIRTNEPLAALLPDLQEAVRTADPTATIVLAQPVEVDLDDQIALPRLSMLLASAFGLTAMFLTVVGLYGVMAFAVRERMHELAVRAALGATPARLRASVVGQATLLAAVGCAAGLLVALGLSPLLRTILFEVSPTDPVVALGSCGLLMTAALLSALAPAKFATRADPARALRGDRFN